MQWPSDWLRAWEEKKENEWELILDMVGTMFWLNSQIVVKLLRLRISVLAV